MSLYRTWRPKSFADLVGQDAVVRTLSTAIETGRLAHAYLFSGPRGSGKTSAAKILARCIECVHGPTATPDNTCDNCEAIFAGTALDVLEIDAASNRGIDEIRALRDAVKFAPATMRMKVYIIDEAHMLTKEGANAFLKTLEEPPPYAVFILATTAPESLPATILSRCQRYAFRRIPIETMIARMRTIAAAENISIDEAALGAIAYRADGGLRDALTMLEQVAAFANGHVDAATVDAAFGQTGREFSRRLMEAALDADAIAALGAVDAASDAGTDMTGLIRGTIAEFRHLLVARINPELLSRDLSADDAAAALDRARSTPQSRLIRGLRLLSDALAAARGSGNARLEVETAVLRFILTHEDPSLDALAARVTALETGTPDAGGPTAAALSSRGTRNGAAAGRPAAGTEAPGVSGLSAAATGESPAVRDGQRTVAGMQAEPERTGDTITGESSASVGPSAEERRSVQETADAATQVGSATLSPIDERPAIAPESSPASSRPPLVQPAQSRVKPPEPRPAAEDVAPRMPASRGPVGRVEPVGELSLQKIRSLWQNVRTRAQSQQVTLSAALAQTTVAALDGDLLTLRVPDPPRAEMLKRHIATLRTAIDGVLGRPLELRILVDNGRHPPVEPAPESIDPPVDLVRYAIDTLP